MSDVLPPEPLDGFRADLVADLKPVARLPAPWLRASLWLGLVALLAAALASFANLPAIGDRLMGNADMGLAVLGSIVTTILATVAAFELDLPDRSRAWAFLPAPGLALWIGASGFGCLRTVFTPGSEGVSMAESSHCMMFIVGLSVPMSAVMFLMLRKGYSLNPSLTGAMAGLAVASAAATLLTFFHPFDAAALDLTVHACAVMIVVLANRLFGDKMLRDRPGKSTQSFR